MRLYSMIATLALLKSASAGSDACNGIAEGGFVCYGDKAFTYCSGGLPSSFGQLPCQTEPKQLSCCQSTKSCLDSTLETCPGGFPKPLATGDFFILNATAGGKTTTTSTTAASNSSVPTTSAAQTSTGGSGGNGNYNPAPPPSGAPPQAQVTSTTVAGGNYQPPPPIVIPPKPVPNPTRSYHSWKHHKHMPKTTTSSRPPKVYHHHVHHYKKPTRPKTYSHHYRTKATVSRTTTSKKPKKTTSVKRIKHVYEGSNVGLDAAGMEVGGVYGEQRARPVEGIIGPDAGIDKNAKQPDGVVPQPYKRPIVNPPAGNGYPGAYPEGPGPFNN